MKNNQWKKIMAGILCLMAVLFAASMFAMNHAMAVRIQMQGEVNEEMMAIITRNRSIYDFCSQIQVYIVLGTLLAGVYFGLAQRSLGALNTAALAGVGEIVLLALFSYWKMGSAFTYTENFQFTYWFWGLFISMYIIALIFIAAIRRKEKEGTLA